MLRGLDLKSILRKVINFHPLVRDSEIPNIGDLFVIRCWCPTNNLTNKTKGSANSGRVAYFKGRRFQELRTLEGLCRYPLLVSHQQQNNSSNHAVGEDTNGGGKIYSSIFEFAKQRIFTFVKLLTIKQKT